jgi:hypothetical protein
VGLVLSLPGFFYCAAMMFGNWLPGKIKPDLFLK